VASAPDDAFAIRELAMRGPLAWITVGMVVGLVANPALAEDRYRLDSLRIDHPFARATPPGAKTGAVFFTVENVGSTEDRLVHAFTPIAAGVAIHQMAL